MQFRCDNERPACSNCKTYGQDCVYTERPERPRCVIGYASHTPQYPLITQRPTKARLSRLEAENEQLRRHLGRVDAIPETSTEPAKISPTQPRQGAQEPPAAGFHERTDIEKTVAGTDRSQSAVSRIFISPNGDSSYHGLTSTLFDDAPTDRQGQPRSADPQVPVEHIRKQLMGESAYQSKSHPLEWSWRYLTFDQGS